MQQLLKQLDYIYELLEQIETITTNQTTVLLQSNEEDSSEVEAVEFLESMFNYKEEIINELEKAEAIFQESYEPYRGKITDKAFIEMIQSKIASIMAKKKTISDAELNNLLVMQAYTKKRTKQFVIPRQAKDVTEAYKKYQPKT